MGIETLILPRDASSTGIGLGEEFLTSLEGNTEIKKVVVPKEVEIFHFALYRNSLGVVSEIEFEDTEGWRISNGGKVKRSIINDPRLMRDFLEKSRTVTLEKRKKVGFLQRIFS